MEGGFTYWQTAKIRCNILQGISMKTLQEQLRPGALVGVHVGNNHRR